MIIWAESFDHYGTDPTDSRTAMLNGAWGAFAGGNTDVAIKTTEARTGSRSLGFRSSGAISPASRARRVLGAAQTVVGCGFGFFASSLPSTNGSYGMSFRTNANTSIVRITVQSDGSIGIYDPSSDLLIASDPIITASAWQHIEAKVVIDNIVGEVEVRVNGQPTLHITDIDLGSNLCTQVDFGIYSTSPGGEDGVWYYFDDIVTWNDVGDFCNDFLGPQRVLTVFPAGDESTQDWTPNGAASGYECIDEDTPDDDDTYISAESVEEISEFTFPTLPPETANIAGVFIPSYAKLSDAGTGNLQVSLISDGEVLSGPDTPLTAAYTYWPSVFEFDPKTEVPWTKNGLEAAKIRVEKTA